MPAPIRDPLPLREVFASLVRRSFEVDVGWRDEEVQTYCTGILVDFVHVDRLYGVQTREGRTVQSLVELLREGDVRLGAETFDRERDVQKHIGDFTLFWRGLFPRHLAWRRRHRPGTADDLLDYVAVGKRSYRIVASFGDEAPFPGSAFFERLADRFELAVCGLEGVAARLGEATGGDPRDLWRLPEP